jgi:hypothetical protein
MTETFRRIQTLVLAGDVRVSDHGFEELAKDAIFVEDLVTDIMTSVLVEDYPDRFRVLTLQEDGRGRPVHVVWALPPEQRRPAILVTAYRPDPTLWENEFRQRRSK